MKNKVIAIIIACLIMLNCIPAYASTNYIAGTDAVNEIKEIEEAIIDEINYTLSSEDVRQFSIEDIDYNKIVTLYKTDQMFLNDYINDEKMQDYVSDNDYSFIIPLYDNDKTVLVSLIKVKPITDEERVSLPAEMLESIESTVGQWIVGSVAVKEGVIDYRADLEKALVENDINNCNVYFTNCCVFVELIAVICDTDSDRTMIKILKQHDGIGEMKSELLDIDVLHSYDEMKAFVESTIVESSDSEEMKYMGMGVSNSSQTEEPTNNTVLVISIISGVAIVAIAVITVLAIRKKKKIKNIES